MGYRVGIVGATGAVGREMLLTLEQRNFPVDEIRLFASARSRGKKLTFKGAEVEVEELTAESLPGCDIYLFSAGAGVSREYAPLAAKSGVVIDNSSAWRMEPNVPLVVPEVNPEDLERHEGIIANPNCSTIQMVVAINPLHREYGIKRVIVSTYQAVSGTGQKAIAELDRQVRQYVAGEELTREVYPYEIAFNAIPRIDVVFDNLYTKEEMKMVLETRKIMHAPDLLITATCVRIPVFRGHAEAITLELRRPATPEEVRELLAAAPGVVVLDDPFQDVYPTPKELAHTDEVYVGRIRTAIAFEYGISLWVVADNLRKGAALNAVQIAETLRERKLL